MKQPPSSQEIQDYLDGLNRLHRSYSGMSAGSVAARQRGINNYLRWFKDHDIKIHLQQRTIWVVSEEDGA